MRRYFALLLLVLLLGCQSTNPVRNDSSASPSVQAAPQFPAEVDYMLLREIRINAPVRPTEEGLIVEVRVIGPGPAFNAVVRYPGTESVLRLEGDNTQKLSPSLQIPNQQFVEVWVNVIAVPNKFTTEGVNISAFALGQLASAATTAIMRKQPLIRLIPDYLLNVLSDETKNQLLKGRVIGSAREKADGLATLARMGTAEIKAKDGNAFVITLEPIRRKPLSIIKRSE